MKKIFSISILAAIIIAACTKENYEKDHPKKVDTTTANPNNPVAKDTCKDSIKYSVQVKRIFANKCGTSGCHDGVSQMDFNNYANVSSDSANIVSRMNDAGNPMPPNGLVDDCMRSQIKSWVSKGAPNN